MSRAIVWLALALTTASSSPDASAASATGQQQTLITLSQGQLAGLTDPHGVRSFKGIPYGEPPVGARRSAKFKH